MGTENLSPPSIADMLRITGSNTATFMDQVAEHIDKLEASVVELQKRITELEGQLDAKE
jgi:ABC-type Zn uptake system ZnuABC Zn-binding protein ZnuA